MHRTDDVTSRIREALVPVVAEHGLHLEECAVGNGGKRRVVRVTVDLADGPGGVDSDVLSAVSRAISARLDDVDLIEGAYTLEVSTPGAERTLTEPRHFRRAEGRLVEIAHAAAGEKGPATVVGRVRGATETHVRLAVDGTEREIPIAEISRARVRIELNRVDEA